MESLPRPANHALHHLLYWKLFRPPNCGVATTVINQYDLEIGKVLGEDRAQTRRDPTLLIVGTNYDRSRQRLISHRPETSSSHFSTTPASSPSRNKSFQSLSGTGIPSRSRCIFISFSGSPGTLARAPGSAIAC